MTTEQNIHDKQHDAALDLWTSTIFAFNREEIQAAPELRKILRSYDCKLARYLADVQEDSPAGGFLRQDVTELETLIIASYGKSKSLTPLRILDKVIFHLNRRFQKCIPRPSQLKLLRSEPNVFMKPNSLAHSCVDVWLKSEQCWIDSCCHWNKHNRSDIATQISWEMVIASAALHCGILDVDCAVALVEALSEPTQFFACSEIRAYADLQVRLHGSSDFVMKRWYPDDRLLLLMSRVSRDSLRIAVSTCSIANETTAERRNRIGDTILRGIHAELKRQSVNPQYLPVSFPDFLETIEQTLRSELPAMLVNFAAGKLASRSLVPESIRRINGDPAAPAAQLESCTDLDLDLEDGTDNPEAYGGNRRRKDEPRWLHGLRDAFAGSDKDQIDEALQGVMEAAKGISPVCIQLCSLARTLILGSASTGNQWAMSSIKCCVLTVARRFGIQRKSGDPAKYSTETLQEIYPQVIYDAGEDSKTPGRLQSKVAWALREYHRHLVCNFGASIVNEAIAFRVDRGLLPVDARIISMDDLFAIIKYIQTAPHAYWPLHYRRVAIAETVLAFLGGLRRAEGLGLELNEYFRSLTGEVLIRDNENRSLKTTNARRGVPLGIFAYPFSELLDYLSAFEKKPDDNVSSLFGGVSEDVIIPIIHEALQNVTQDNRCHLHSLRHSFGHWMYCRLMLAQLGDIPDMFPHLPLTTKWLQAAKEFRQLLYWNSTVDNDHGWAAATELGHSNPKDVSAVHYIHCFDILLAQYLEQNPVYGSVEDDQLRKMSGLPKTTAYERYPLEWSNSPSADMEAIDTLSLKSTAHKKRVAKRASFARDLFIERFGLNVVTHRDTIIRLQPQTSWLRTTRNVLLLSANLHMPVRELASTVGLDATTTALIMNSAAEIAKLQTVDQRTYLHKMVGLPLGRNGDKREARSYCPAAPRGEVANALIDAFAATIQKQILPKPEKSRDALAHLARNILPHSACIAFFEPLDPATVHSCLALFRKMGFGQEKIRGYSCDGSKRATPTREWLKGWGLSWRCKVVNQWGRERMLKVPGSWLVLEPIFTCQNDSDPSATSQAQAFRYTLVMAAIRFGHRIGDDLVGKLGADQVKSEDACPQ